MNTPRRRQKPRTHAHGWTRRDDATQSGLEGAPATARSRIHAPAGTAFLLTLVVAVGTAMGIVRVQARTEVLAVGAEIAELTAEHAALLEERRRLAAERAYLRHPDRLEEVARKELGMVPVSSDRVQQIRLVAEEDTP